jgi:hypothetical protein
MRASSIEFGHLRATWRAIKKTYFIYLYNIYIYRLKKAWEATDETNINGNASSKHLAMLDIETPIPNENKKQRHAE